MFGTRLGIKDNFLRAIVRSWPPWIRIALCISVIFTNFRIFEILSLTRPIAYLSKHWPLILYTAFNFNIRFSGLLMFVFFMIWRQGWITEIIMARPEDRPRSNLNVVGKSLLLYMAVIILLSLVYQSFFRLGSINRNLIVWEYFWQLFFLCFLTPINEEIQYRFVLFYTLDSFFGRVAATLLTVFLFMISHPYPLPGLVYVALVGLIASLLTMRNGTLWPAILFHSFVNISANFQTALYFS